MSEDLWRFFGAAIGVTDFVLLLFRTTPFNWHDLSLIDSAMQVMNHYVSGIGFVAIGAVIAACIVLIVVLFKKAARLEKRPNYKKGAASVVTVALLTVYFWGVGRWSAILPRNFSNIAESLSDLWSCLLLYKFIHQHWNFKA